MCIYVINVKNKKPLHYHFLTPVLEVFIWTLVVIIQGLYSYDSDISNFWENVSYFSSAAIPVSVIFLGKVYSETPLTQKYWLLYILPAISVVMIWTNPLHHWFFVQYATSDQPFVYGPYFYIHAIYSYVCLIYGFAMLIYYALKNSGLLSVQAFLILLGSVTPFIVNVFYTFKIAGFDVYSTPIGFTVTLVVYMLAMFRFNLLRVSPIALQTVINRISDSFIVLDKEMNVLDFNRTFMENFNYIKKPEKGDQSESRRIRSGGETAQGPGIMRYGGKRAGSQRHHHTGRGFRAERRPAVLYG
jgi:hypothetical protein